MVLLRKAPCIVAFLSPIFLCHKIKDGGYNNTNMNKLSPTLTLTPPFALESGHTAKMIKLIFIIKTFIFHEQRNKKIKEVNKTEPREIIQVWNRKKNSQVFTMR